MSKTQNAKWGVKVAYSVLHIFEKESPSDTGPRELLDFMSSLKDFEHISSKTLAELKAMRNQISIIYENEYAAAAAKAVQAACSVICAIAGSPITRIFTSTRLYTHTAADYADDAASAHTPLATRASRTKARILQENLNLKLLLEVYEMER